MNTDNTQKQFVCENPKCGKIHDGTYGTGRFCSAHCKQVYAVILSNKSPKRKHVQVCSKCGNEYLAGKGKKINLCKDCYRKIKAIEEKNKFEQNRIANIKPGICEECGNEHDGSYKTGRFCSSKCAHRYAAKHVKSENIKHGMKNSTKMRIIKCSRCGKDVKVNGSVSNILCKECKIVSTLNPSGKCLICGKSVSTNRKTCCKEHAKILIGQTISKNTKGTGKVGGFRERSSNGKRGWYKGFYCASTYELAFVIYCLDHNISIRRNKKYYWYEYEGQRHKYYPDWIVNEDHLVETKNFITELVEIKAAAVNDMPIEILDTVKLQPYFEYVAKTYGKTYHNKSNNFYELYEKHD